MANEAQIQLAIDSIQNGEQRSIRSAATTYGIPKKQHRILWRSCKECDDWFCGNCFQMILLCVKDVRKIHY